MCSPASGRKSAGPPRRHGPPCHISQKSGTGVRHVNSIPNNRLRCQRQACATFFTQGGKWHTPWLSRTDFKTHGSDKFEFSPRLCIGNCTRRPRSASRSIAEHTVFVCVLSVLCVSILALRAGPITKPVFRHASNPAATRPDHCEKNRTWFSQWFVVITFAMPCCCDIRGDHCEKNVRASHDFAQWSGWRPN